MNRMAPKLIEKFEILKRHRSILTSYKGHMIVLEWEISRIVGHEKELKIDHGKLLSGSQA